MSHDADVEIPVLIVGGSMVGMTAAQRTMEILRGVGLEQVIRAKSEAQFVQDAGVVGVETLAGGATAHYIANFNDGIRDLSPTVRVFLSQNALEPTLKESAEERGARILFSTECVSFEQDASGITALVRHRDTGETQRIHAQYLIAADGAHSPIRERLGIRMLGHGTLSKSITIYFRADLRRFLEGKLWAVVYANHPQLRGFFRFEKPFESAFLAVNTVGDPAQPNVDVSTGLTTDGALQLVRTAIGVPDIPVTIENVMHWKATADTAEHFREGRILIAGDAAHVMPPTGGWGGNVGVQDAHNLAWKLAYVLEGHAGAELLSTYEPERRPIDELTVEQAYTRYVLRTDPSIPKDAMQPLVNDLDIELGYGYRSAAVIPEADGAPLHLSPRETHAMPGTRAPHYWLHRDGEQISTLDLFNRNFTLLAASEGAAWCEAAVGAAEQLGLELDVFRLAQDGLHDPTGGFAAAYELEPTGCVLVRPDGFVAWRAKDGSGASTTRVHSAVGSILCR